MDWRVRSRGTREVTSGFSRPGGGRTGTLAWVQLRLGTREVDGERFARAIEVTPCSRPPRHFHHLIPRRLITVTATCRSPAAETGVSACVSGIRRRPVDSAFSESSIFASGRSCVAPPGSDRLPCLELVRPEG
jgi:hypothetical protein